jgi:hypothetical protein
VHSAALHKNDDADTAVRRHSVTARVERRDDGAVRKYGSGDADIGDKIHSATAQST